MTLIPLRNGSAIASPGPCLYSCSARFDRSPPVFYRELFHSLGSIYVIVDAHGFPRSQPALDASLERVPRFEARRVLETIVRSEPGLFARLYEALTGVRPPASGLSSSGSIGSAEAFLLRLTGAFGVDRPAFDPAGPDLARFYLLRRRRGAGAVSARQDSPEGRRIGEALAKFGRGSFIHRGDSYHLQRAGMNQLPNRNTYSVVREAELFSVLAVLGSDPGLDADKKAALPELLAAAEAQRAQKGTTELLLLRRQRATLRPAQEDAPLTPSQLRQSQRHFLAVEVVDEDEKPVAGLPVEVELSDGDLKRAVSGADGLARIEPVPPGNVLIRVPSLDGSDWRPVGGGARASGQKGPPRQHTVKQGDTLARIARRYGLRSWKQVWDAPENEALRKKRKSPHVLHPGDRVAVPGITVHECERPVDQVHRLIVKPDAKLTLRLNLLGKKREPLQGATSKIFVGEELLFEGPVNDGKLECEIPLSVTEARLVVSVDGFELERPLQIGALDPADQLSGVQARLSNLGWFSGPADGASSEALMLAQNTFRHEREIEPAETLDDALFSELEKAHLV
jgi:LysM domain